MSKNGLSKPKKKMAEYSVGVFSHFKKFSLLRQINWV